MTADAVHVYWRPRCAFCTLLRRRLAAAGIETIDHDIWDDREAAAVVRRHAAGCETVPTVVVGDVGLVNPSAAQVTDHLGRCAPHLLPGDLEAPRRGLLRQLLG